MKWKMGQPGPLESLESGNRGQAGFTPNERARFERICRRARLVDPFRLMHKDVAGHKVSLNAGCALLACCWLSCFRRIRVYYYLSVVARRACSVGSVEMKFQPAPCPGCTGSGCACCCGGGGGGGGGGVCVRWCCARIGLAGHRGTVLFLERLPREDCAVRTRRVQQPHACLLSSSSLSSLCCCRCCCCRRHRC
jgi:hypothetical protein